MYYLRHIFNSLPHINVVYSYDPDDLDFFEILPILIPLIRLSCQFNYTNHLKLESKMMI